MSWAPLRHGRPRAAGNSSPTTSRICASDCWGAAQTPPSRAAGGVIERRRIRVGASPGVRCVRVSRATSGWSRRRLWQQPRQLNLSQHAPTAANCSRERCDECPTRQGETRHAPTRAYWLCCLVIGWVGFKSPRRLRFAAGTDRRLGECHTGGHSGHADRVAMPHGSGRSLVAHHRCRGATMSTAAAARALTIAAAIAQLPGRRPAAQHRR